MYSWNATDVMYLAGISINPDKREQYIECPFCGQKKFSYNIKGFGHCLRASCGKGADIRGIYAEKKGLSLIEAGKELDKLLNKDSAPIIKPSERKIFVPKKEEPINSSKERDRFYTALLSKLVLSDEHRQALRARGFSDDWIEACGYKSYPEKGQIDWRELLNEIESEGIKIFGNPGTSSYKGNPQFVDYYTPGIIMPQKNCRNEKFGLMLRKDNDKRRYFDGRLEGKCCWITSADIERGTKAKVGVHYATDFIYSGEYNCYKPVIEGNKVILTEGSMKADLAAELFRELTGKNASFISVSGVSQYTALIEEFPKLKSLGVKEIQLAYDMDYLTNPDVQEALQRTETLIRESGFEFTWLKWPTDVKENSGSKLKGIDDFLAYRVKKIIPV